MSELMRFFTNSEVVQSMTAELRALVALESPTTDKAAVDALGRRLAGRLGELGAELTIDRQAVTGDHLIARWSASGAAGADAGVDTGVDTGAVAGTPADAAGSAPDGQPGILILCHMDTVCDIGTLARQPCVEEDGRLYGPGVYDMKAGIVIVLHALAGLRALGRRARGPLTVLLTADEERGSRTSRALIEQEARRSRLVLCMEPALATGALKTFRKGTGLYRVSITGRAAHAGADHEAGINAIEELALQIVRLQRLTSYRSGTTVNVGTVTGGTRTNVVPEFAECWVDLRVASRADGERMHEVFTSLQPHLPGAQVSVTGGLNRPPMERDALMRATFARAQAVAAAHGLALKEGDSGGGSDANFTAARGVPTLDGLGAIGWGAHAIDEHVRLSSLPQRAALLAALLLGM
jgi:glutamate carboxypeptidase